MEPQAPAVLDEMRRTVLEIIVTEGRVECCHDIHGDGVDVYALVRLFDCASFFFPFRQYAGMRVEVDDGSEGESELPGPVHILHGEGEARTRGGASNSHIVR